MQGIKMERDGTHILAKTVRSAAVVTTGAPNTSLTTVCDATSGFAPDILIRAITAGQLDLHLK